RTALALSGTWALGLGSLGFFLPYFTLYLTENAGLRGAQAGAITALLPLMGLVAQPVWGQIADRTGRRARVVAAICIGAAAANLALGAQSTFAGFALATAALALFVTSFGAMTLAASISALGAAGARGLGRVRVWGTLGFGAAALSVPPLLRALDGAGLAPGVEAPGASAPALGAIYPAASLWRACAAAAALAVPEARGGALRAERGEWRALARDGRFARALAFVFLAYLSMQGPMQMFPLLVRSHGGGVDAIARMWLVMIALEAPLMFVLGRSVDRFSARGIVAIGIVASAVRWLVSGATDDLRVLTAVQALHGVTVWGVMMGMPLYVDALVPERLRATGQSAVGLAGSCLGAVASNLVAGWLVDAGGGRAPALAGGALALACALLLPVLLPRPPRTAA
ncbi:MAG: MFS transporter, partial [Myxococcota bacterium]